MGTQAAASGTTLLQQDSLQVTPTYRLARRQQAQDVVKATAVLLLSAILLGCYKLIKLLSTDDGQHSFTVGIQHDIPGQDQPQATCLHATSVWQCACLTAQHFSRSWHTVITTASFGSQERWLMTVIWLELAALTAVCLSPPLTYTQVLRSTYTLFLHSCYPLLHVYHLLSSSSAPTAAAWQHIRFFPFFRSASCALFPTTLVLEAAVTFLSTCLNLCLVLAYRTKHPHLPGASLPTQLLLNAACIVFTLTRRPLAARVLAWRSSARRGTASTAAAAAAAAGRPAPSAGAHSAVESAAVNETDRAGASAAAATAIAQQVKGGDSERVQVQGEDARDLATTAALSVQGGSSGHLQCEGTFDQLQGLGAHDLGSYFIVPQEVEEHPLECRSPVSTSSALYSGTTTSNSADCSTVGFPVEAAAAQRRADAACEYARNCGAATAAAAAAAAAAAPAAALYVPAIAADAGHDISKTGELRLRYRSRAAHRHISMKIMDAEPWQAVQRYQAELQGLLCGSGYELLAVHMRPGCIELLVVMRPMHAHMHTERLALEHRSARALPDEPAEGGQAATSAAADGCRGRGDGVGAGEVDGTALARAVYGALGLPPARRRVLVWDSGSGGGPSAPAAAAASYRAEEEAGGLQPEEADADCHTGSSGNNGDGGSSSSRPQERSVGASGTAPRAGAAAGSPREGVPGADAATRGGGDGGSVGAEGRDAGCVQVELLSPRVVAAAAACGGDGDAAGVDSSAGNVALRLALCGLPPGADAAACCAVCDAAGFLPLHVSKASREGQPGAGSGHGSCTAGPAVLAAIPEEVQEPGSGSGADAGSAAPVVVVDVVLPPVRRAGLLLVAARPRPGAVLGCARPLLAAPSAAVAAELSALVPAPGVVPGSTDSRDLDEMLEDLGSWWDYVAAGAAVQQEVQRVVSAGVKAAGAGGTTGNGATVAAPTASRHMAETCADLVLHMVACGCSETASQLVSELSALGYGVADVAPGRLLTRGSPNLMEAARSSGSSQAVRLVESWQANAAEDSSSPAAGSPGSDSSNGVCGSGGSGAAVAAAAAGGGRKLQLARLALLQALGWSRGSREQEVAFWAYAEGWMIAQGRVMQCLDLLLLAAFLWSSGPAGLLDAPAIAACSYSLAAAAAQALLPPARARQLLAHGGAAALHQLGYMAGQALVLYGRWAPHPHILQCHTGACTVVMEGLVIPASCLVPPLAALALSLARMPLQAALHIQACAQLHASTCLPTPFHAWLRAALIALISVATSLGCATYLRLGFLRRSQRQANAKAGGRDGSAASGSSSSTGSGSSETLLPGSGSSGNARAGSGRGQRPKRE